MGFTDPIVPEPDWGRPSPDIPDEEIYDEDEFEDDDDDFEDQIPQPSLFKRE